MGACSSSDTSNNKAKEENRPVEKGVTKYSSG